MTDVSREIAELRIRLQRLEDERDIARLIASYGPAVDSADADTAAGLWAEDGSYDVEGWRMNSSADVQAMVASAAHRQLVDTGCCHFLGPAVVTVSGESAVAVCESLVLLRRSEPLPHSDFDLQAWDSSAQEYMIWRASANHFELERGTGGWRISRRTSGMLAGREAALRLLRSGVRGVRLVDAQKEGS
ncbi:hypothetical protein A5649_05865 [Mycolicibacter heraklionensis]|uniref:SnoaL-like domain-containing protein n=1 Tax=Mycolicibacter heraklionensis TaxID=512402 RepID=A0AA91ETI6_9MYCO|nr:nuclear transport factor 2 family protein [Mycolicibacter heraklionensis]OBK83883.1 hypothetical protein A5649_05865 [Mycolicibacter heraklionensis]